MERKNENRRVRANAAIAAMDTLLSAVSSDPDLLLSFNRAAAEEGKTNAQIIAKYAVAYADALVEELNGKEDEA